MSLPPGPTCFTRPFRAKPRVFTEKDVARIARYVVKGGVSPLKVVGVVAGVLGFGWILCIAARAIDNAFTLTKFIAKIGGILALSRLIDFFLTVFTSGAFQRLARVARVSALVLLLIAVMDGLRKAISGVIGDAAIIEEASGFLHEACDAAKEAAKAAGESIGDKYSDVADWVDDF